MRTRLRRQDVQIQNQCGEAPDDAHQKRVRYILWGFLALFGVITLRLALLHLNPHHALTEEERRHIGRIILEEERGEILDRNGLRLATNRKVPSLWVNPSQVKDPDRLAALVSEKLDISYEDAYAKLTQRSSRNEPMKFVWLKQWLDDVPQETIDAVTSASDGAISVREQSMRFYPQEDTAAHILGFAGASGDEIRGLEGLELAYDDHMATTPGEFRARKDARRRLLESEQLGYEPVQGGDDVQLTIDTTIQHALEEALDRRLIEREAPRGMGVVLDPYTGAVLALASRPAFDPNDYLDVSKNARELLRNRALLDNFEPGSVMKIVPAAAALEHGLIAPDTIIDCEWGRFNPYGHTIKDISKMGEEPFTTCFAKSSNIAIVKVAKLIGPERLEAWIRRFGFGETTSPDFMYESAGVFRPLSRWNGLSMGSLPMGQEISVTVMQVARAFAVIANGGFLVEPYMVERAIARDGSITYAHQAPTPQRMISPGTASTMQQLCREVVANGTGKAAVIPQYRSGGKSGTAQMAYKDRRGYDPDRNTAVYAGFAPISKPRLVCVIVVQEPKLIPRYGGYVCGPVFSEVMYKALTHLQVPADPEEGERAPESAPQEREEPEEQDADLLVARLDEEEIASIEDSIEMLLEPLDGLELREVSTHDVLGAIHPGAHSRRLNGEGGLPDLTGLTKRQAREQLHALGVAWNPSGAGWVVAQAPPAGTPLQEVSLCSLEFGARRPEEVTDEAESTL